MRRNIRPLTHEWIWGALDALAVRHGLSPSALARLAGLDPTTFNKSKRFTPEGRPRWPSTESIAKVLEATQTTLDAFAATEIAEAAILTSRDSVGRDITDLPTVGEVRNATVRNFAPIAGPAHSKASEAGGAQSGRLYALSVLDNSLEPVFSSGHTLVVSEAVETRAGDRVVVKPAGLPPLPRLLLATSKEEVELRRFSESSGSQSVRREDIDWMARIVLVRK